MRIIYTDIAELSFEENESMLLVKIREDADLNIYNIVTHFNAIKNITNEKRYLLFIDASNLFTIDENALSYIASTEVMENRIAVSYYTLNLANRLKANYFLRVYEPKVPMRIFNTKHEGINWLKSLIHQSALF